MGFLSHVLLAALVAWCGRTSLALDNGLRVPPLGWSSWYGFTSNINETMLRAMGDGMVTSGLHAAGYKHIWIDDGWAIGRDNKTGHVIVDPVLFPSGMRNLSDYLHSRGLKFGIYTSKGPKTCLGYQPTQPDRPGSCGFEQVDANVYVHEWNVDQVKDDGCGACPQHEPFAAMRDALNKTGKAVWYAIHSSTAPGSPNATVANMWRTGGDLSSSSFDMWTNRLDLATTHSQATLAGPGAFPNPDFLEVGYSPRNPKGNARVQSALEQRSMFTMWAALPGPLILSADLRPGASCGGIDTQSLATLTNPEVIAVNQDFAAQPMRLVFEASGLQAWKKALAAPPGSFAVVLFHRNHSALGAGTGVGDHPALTMGGCDSQPGFDLAIGSSSTPSPIRVRSNSSMCVGVVGECSCANPPSTPKVGLVPCNVTDVRQLWNCINCSAPGGGVIRNGAGTSNHDLNAGPRCEGNPDVSMLLYPTQRHANEMFTYNASTGEIMLAGGGLCLTTGSAPPPPPSPRVISVTWQQLGLSPNTSVAVRNLWQRKTVGNYTGSFAAPVAYHEAAIFKFVPNLPL